MRLDRLPGLVVTLSWGLWFGGIITLFLAVTSLFHTFAPDKALAGAAAAGVFRRFELYQLALAAVAVVATLAWRGAAGPPARRRRSDVLVLLLIATGVALASTFVVSSRIESLRRQGLTDTPRFRSLHGASMALYLSEAGLLLAAGLLIPGALASPRPTSDGTGQDAPRVTSA